MKRIKSLPGAGARIATSVVIGLAATFLFACANDSTPTSPSVAASFSRVSAGNQDRIVFLSDRDNYPGNYNYDIYSMLPDGSGALRLTKTFDNAYPALSPDRKHIVFTSNRDNYLHDIYVMNSDGTNVKRLTTTTAVNYKPTWSADGTKIVFTSTRDAPHPSAYGIASSYEIYIMNADGSNVKRVTNDSYGEWDPVLSPDGTQIAFTSDRDHPESSWSRDLYIMNVDGSNLHRLTTQTGTIEAPNYDAAGKRLLYDVLNGSGVGVYVLSGHTSTRLTAPVGALDITPTWSPDGTQIAYTHAITGGSSNIYKMNADGSNPKWLTRDPYYTQRSDWGR